MSDFQDCLKRRFASVAVGEFKPGKFAEVQHLYEQVISTYSDGFEGAYLFQEPGTDKGVSVILWDNLEDMEASESEEQKAMLNKMAPYFSEPPKVSVYELVCKIDPSETKK